MIVSSAISDTNPKSELDILVESFDEWQISKSTFCPEEWVVIRVTVTNRTSHAKDIFLGYGSPARAYFKVTDASGNPVWDTDKADQLEEEAHAREHGIGRIFAGYGEYSRHTLQPQDSAFWLDRWDQKDLDGKLVSRGQYLVTMDYRWAASEDDRIPVSTAPIEIVISDEGCN